MWTGAIWTSKRVPMYEESAACFCRGVDQPYRCTWRGPVIEYGHISVMQRVALTAVVCWLRVDVAVVQMAPMMLLYTRAPVILVVGGLLSLILTPGVFHGTAVCT